MLKTAPQVDQETTNALGIAGRRELNCRRVASNPDANNPDDPNNPDPDNPDPHPYA